MTANRAVGCDEALRMRPYLSRCSCAIDHPIVCVFRDAGTADGARVRRAVFVDTIAGGGVENNVGVAVESAVGVG